MHEDITDVMPIKTAILSNEIWTQVRLAASVEFPQRYSNRKKKKLIWSLLLHFVVMLIQATGRIKWSTFIQGPQLQANYET